MIQRHFTAAGGQKKNWQGIWLSVAFWISSFVFLSLLRRKPMPQV